jgi:hypothetical protein
MSYPRRPFHRAAPWRATLACLAVAATVGCAARTTTATRTADGDVALRWSASVSPIASSPPLIPPITGNATLSPSSGERQSVAVLSLESAPGLGAVLPWRLYHGGCEGGGTLLGSPGDYPFLQLRADGTGQATATLPIEVPSSGVLSVRVYGSPNRLDAPIACGVLRQGVL